MEKELELELIVTEEEMKQIKEGKGFLPYRSVINHYSEGTIERVKKYYSQENYIATEKIDGANIQFMMIEGKVISIGSRKMKLATVNNGLIHQLENFKDFKTTVENGNYIEKIEEYAFSTNKKNGIFYGELFGEGVVKRMPYTTNTKNGKDIVVYAYVDIDNKNYYALTNKDIDFGLKPLFYGTFDELLNKNVEDLKSRYAPEQEHGLEGIVIVLAEPFNAFVDGAIPLIKLKTKHFSEKKIQRKERTKMSEILEPYQEEVISMVTMNRLENILSHGIKLNDKTDFGNVIKEYLSDLRKEFDYESFPDVNEKELLRFKKVTNEISKLLHKYLEDESK